MTTIVNTTSHISTWEINANGSQGVLPLTSNDNVSLSGSVTFADSFSPEELKFVSQILLSIPDIECLVCVMRVNLS